MMPNWHVIKEELAASLKQELNKENSMCEQTDWLRDLKEISWAVSSLEILFQRGSSEKQVFESAQRGIRSRLEWIVEHAEAERKEYNKVRSAYALTQSHGG